MRLGFWNRLAVVGTGLAVLIAPLTIQFKVAAEQAETRQMLYKLCYDGATERLDAAVNANQPSKFGEEAARCDATFRKDTYTPFTWSNWRSLAGGTLGVAAVFYVLLGLVGIIARWVWRGRAIKNE